MQILSVHTLRKGNPIVKCSLILLMNFLLGSCGTKKLSSEIDESIYLEKTGCLRGCAAYKVSVNKSGSAEFEGISNVARLGKYSLKLSSNENDIIWRLINQDSLLSLKDSYNYGAEDTQQQFLKYYSKGQLVKGVRYGPFPPHYIKKLEEELDRIVQQEGWHKIE